MALNAFQISNYRAFAEPARIELRPLTLLFGYNNAGKSALARVLPLLRDSVLSRSPLPLDMDSRTIRGGEFSDLRCKLTGTRQIELGFDWPNLSLQLTLQDLPDLRQHVIEHITLTHGPRTWSFSWVIRETNDLGRQSYSLKVEGEPEAQIDVEWRGLTPVRTDSKPPSSAGVALQIAGRALRALEGVLWVGAIRAAQPRVAKFPRVKPETIADTGTGSGDVLAWHKQYNGEIFPLVSQWYADHAGTPLDVALRGEEYALVTGPRQVNLSDTGEGLTQVLPALVAGALGAERAAAGADSYVVVEQPELHLHPSLHAPLADFFCKLASRPKNPRMIIETHSENFLFGVQIAVASGQLKPDDVLIHWIRQTENGTATVAPMPFDDEGRPQGWPRGVFTEEAELARRLLEARKKRSRS